MRMNRAQTANPPKTAPKTAAPNTAPNTAPKTNGAKAGARIAGGWRGAVLGAMLGALVAAAALLASARPAAAQDNPSPEQLKKMYDDAVKQLKETQDRVKELADDKEKLKAQVQDLEKRLAAVSKERDDLRREQEEQADKTFFLRSHYAAWESFIRQYPELRARWKVYMESDFISPRHDPKIVDEDWPTSADS